MVTAGLTPRACTGYPAVVVSSTKTASAPGQQCAPSGDRGPLGSNDHDLWQSPHGSSGHAQSLDEIVESHRLIDHDAEIEPGAETATASMQQYALKVVALRRVFEDSDQLVEHRDRERIATLRIVQLDTQQGSLVEDLDG